MEFKLESLNKVYKNIEKLEKKIKKQNKKIQSNSYIEYDNQFEYEYLYPKNIDCFEYIKILNNSIINHEAKNIALSGGYGVGKSSILKSFINSNEKHKFLSISLANFSDLKKTSDKNVKIKKDDSYDITENEIINKIEENIVKQMFYKVKYNNIPFSRYKRINHISNFRNFLNILLINIFIFVSIYIFKPDIIDKFSNKLQIFMGVDFFNKIRDFIPDYINVEKSNTIKLIFLGVFLLGWFVLLMILNKNISLAKWSIKTKIIGDIELEKNNIEESIFNKNIDEILYFFEATDYNVVVFEDLDRFNNIDIFVRLRELNILINNSEQINRKITFIYAMRDDIFDSYTDRNKFFDLIIPVIPVINGLNSEEHFKCRLNTGEDKVSENLIQNVSLHISDMRTLINICNEFKLYKKQLNKTGEKILNKLFAMIVYKNIEPVDFGKLQKGKGLIWELFNKKDVDRMIETYKLNKSKTIISDYDSRINKLQDEFLFRFDESINHVYNITNSNLSFEGTSLDKYLLNKEDLKLKIFKTEDYLDCDIVDTKNSTKIRVNELLNNPKNGSYRDREKYIIEERDLKLKEIDEITAEKFKDVNMLHNMSVNMAIKEYGKDILCEELSNKSLIVYFLKEGYIDENYNDYITYFYPGYLSYKDKQFLISLQGMDYLGFDYKLDNVERVLKKINLDVFRNKSVLNYYLIDYIIKNKSSEECKKYYDKLINIIECPREQSIENDYISRDDINTFIYKYTIMNIQEILLRKTSDPTYKYEKDTINKDIQIDFISKYIDVDEFCKKLKKDENIDEIIINMLIYSTEILEKNNKDNNNIYRKIYKNMSSDISKMDNFLSLLNSNYKNTFKYNRSEILVDILIESNVKFKNLNLEKLKIYKGNESIVMGDAKSVIDNIIENNLYDIKYNMLDLIINDYLDLKLEYFNINLIKSFLSESTGNHRIDKLKGYINNYIDDDINTYISEIYDEFMYKNEALNNNSIKLNHSEEMISKDIEYLKDKNKKLKDKNIELNIQGLENSFSQRFNKNI